MNKQQLASKIWESANKMRSKIEANEYKDYILGFIFYKFLSETEVARLKARDFAEEDLPNLVEDDEETVEFVKGECGYFIAYDNLFSTWVAKGGDFEISNVRDALSAFSRNIDPARKRVFDGIFDTLQTGLSKLGTDARSQSKAARDLIYLIKDIPMDGRQDYDVLGFIYEYLISNFAANAGKKAGEFYTPHEVSMLMSEIISWHLAGRENITIYDPTSGSGSLLINIGKAVARRNGDPDSIKYYAQELKENTYNLTRMNLVMRGILPDNIVARNGDTLEDDWPWFDTVENKDETYDPLFVDAVVSNPPYSQNWDPEDKDLDPRFKFGVAPKSKADYAFLLHDLYHLRPDGIMCIVLPHGVLFRGGDEGTIRKNLVEYRHIQAIIGLPANIFFGTGIPTIIMVLRKQRESSDVLVVDASKHFVKEGKNNKLRASDIKRIVDAVTTNATVDKFSRLIPIDEIRANDYNLNIPRYVDSSTAAESWDVYATMFGGVPKAELNEENLEALEAGLPNLLQHVENITTVYKLPCVVAINAFPTDTKAELDFVEAKCKELGVNVALSEVWAKGGEGGIKLAEEVLRLVEEPNDFTYAYELEGSIEDKLNQIVQKVYGGKRVVLTANAQKQAKQLEALGFGNCPICVAKTQYSLTDDQTKLGAPTDFEVTVRNLKISAGAGFIVALTGEIMTMPGLPKVPAATKIDVDESGKITGLF